MRRLAATHGRRAMSTVIPGGRSSVSGVTATVLGSTGMLGRYVVNKLGRVGSQVVVPYRGNEEDSRHLKLMGDLGMIVPMPFHARDFDSIVKTVERSDIVINCIGKQELTMNFNFFGANVETAHNIARACAEAGVPRLIHVSALAADEGSPSEWVRRKAEGEQAVLSHFPGATIVRPSVMFGEEDKFLNLIAKWYQIMGVCPMYGAANNKIRPVYVDDVAEAIRAVVFDPVKDGGVYDLEGPEEYTLRQIVEWVRVQTQREGLASIRTIAPDLTMFLPEGMESYSPHRGGMDVSDFFYRMWPAALPGAPANLGVRGDANMLFNTEWVASGANPGFESFFMKPTSMKGVAPEYLRHYIKGGQFATQESHDGRGTLT
uniref:NAD-dependent epimerase/dehydratase domain-containing protein n=1 Tax=Hemiselmis tepida TaxID=464990 RepID=A0A7S0VSX6_9CRYP